MARSVIVGIPSGRCLPFAFGIYTRRSGWADSRAGVGSIAVACRGPTPHGRLPAVSFPVLCHSFDGQRLAAKRVGKQPLQGFHLAPATCLCCLYDTRLEPADLALVFSPVHLVPRRNASGGCTRDFHHVHLQFPPCRFCWLSRNERPAGSQARFRGGVMLQLLSDSLQTGIRFLQSPLPAIPTTHLTMRSASLGGCRVYRVSLQ